MKKDLNTLIEQIQITDVIGEFSNLVKNGSSYKTLCNVHGDTTPSLSINPRKQIYKCFVCDHGGNALDYLIWAQNFSYTDALKYLANLAGENVNDYLNYQQLPTKKDPVIEKLILSAEKINHFGAYYLDLNKENEPLKSWLSVKQLTSKTINHFQLGYFDQDVFNILKDKIAPSDLINLGIVNDQNKLIYQNRITFPIFNHQGQPVSLSGRTLAALNESNPKYLHGKTSQIFSKNQVLYNYHQAKTYQKIYLCEGFMDVIALFQSGYPNAIALMGLDCSEERQQVLKNHKLVLCLDQDRPGRQATIRLIHTLIKNHPDLEVIYFDHPEAKDIDELIRADQTKSKIAIEQPLSAYDFAYQYYFNDIDWNDQKVVEQNLNSFAKLLNYDPIKNQIYQNRLFKDFDFHYDFNKKATKNKDWQAIDDLDLAIISCFYQPQVLQNPQVVNQILNTDWKDINKWKMIKKLLNLELDFSPSQIKSFDKLIMNHRNNLLTSDQQLIEHLQKLATTNEFSKTKASFKN